MMANEDLRILKYDDTDPNANFMSIESWSAHALREERTVPRRTYNYFVTRLEWYKNRHGFQHEYVVASVLRDDDDRSVSPSNPSYLRFDRRSSARQVEEPKAEMLLSEEERAELSSKEVKAIDMACQAELAYINVKKVLYAASTSQSITTSFNKPLKASDVFMWKTPSDALSGLLKDVAIDWEVDAVYRTFFTLGR